MQNEASDRAELQRMADDGCPNTSGDTRTYDLSEVRDGLSGMGRRPSSSAKAATSPR